MSAAKQPSVRFALTVVIDALVESGQSGPDICHLISALYHGEAWTTDAAFKYACDQAAIHAITKGAMAKNPLVTAATESVAVFYVLAARFDGLLDGYTGKKQANDAAVALRKAIRAATGQR